ncbi:netrin receptor unc-5 [Plutella xylostella]|uniref:netrin receptor unc-5 n=1 Tax=Plutella xylostella TaxID=51655 RepID=UPI002032AC53|nr:netrin receptor unc-5 [Plutella xylostella]
MCLLGSSRWIIVLTMVMHVGIVRNTETRTPKPKELRPEYIHPDGVENLDPYLKDYQPKDNDSEDEEDEDYLPLPDNHETIEGLPIFLIEPKNSYVLKNKPATLLCRAANALQVYFKCNGVRIDKTAQFEHVDPQNGVRVVESELNVTRNELDEYFGSGRYNCECFAWNSKGHIRSQGVFVELAYIKKQFTIAPQSASIEVGRSVSLRCVPPASAPPSSLTWLRNGLALEARDENLVLPRVSLQDMANYTCLSENIAGRRESEPAVLTVYVNGGWSDWSPWSPCRCGTATGGKRRTRSCTQPAPANGGAPCRGSANQRSEDCLQCQSGGVWSPWGPWSSCTADCLRVRKRQCAGTCSGPTLQHAACVDGLCANSSVSQHTAAILLGLGAALAVLAAGAALLCVWCRGRNVRRPGYTIASSGIPKSYSGRDKGAAPDLTRSCNEYWMSSDNHYDMPHVRDSYSSPFGHRSASRAPSAGGSNHYEMKPYSPSAESGSSSCTYTRTITSRSSDYSTSPLAELVSTSPPSSSKVNVAVTLPGVPMDSSYRDKICLTVVK